MRHSKTFILLHILARSKKIDLGLNGGGLGYGSLWAKKVAIGSHFLPSSHARSTRGNYVYLPQTFFSSATGWPKSSCLTQMQPR